MARWPWIERTFNFDYPVGKFPDILERLRGMPVRVAAMVAGLDAAVLVGSDGQGWSIQENVGHLSDVHPLMMKRIDELLEGVDVLTAADMTNRGTREANHNAREIGDLLSELRRVRGEMVTRFGQLDEDNWGKVALHPRLNQPMRVVDLAYFNAEHDDYHLARIRELMQRLT